MIILYIVTLVFGFYLLYLGIILWRIPQENIEEFRKFKGNGRGMIMRKDGKIISVKYRTHDDWIRFMSGMRVIDFNND